MKKVEIEVKLRAGDLQGLETRLTALGVTLLHPREFEDNHLYDFPGLTLQKAGAMLRVRAHGRGAALTHKEGARVVDGAKVRDEIEVEVGDAGTLSDILGKLGLVQCFRYQKYRTTYQYHDLLLTLDETPIGVFFELEGPKKTIDDLAGKLGYSPADYITATYRDLFLSARKDAKSGHDMLFDGR
jgi:adenylate cyclase class 2